MGRTLSPYKLHGNKLKKGGSGKAMTGQKLWNAAGHDGAMKVHTLLSTQGAFAEARERAREKVDY